MECHNCELIQRKFYCINCLRNHVRELRNATEHVEKERSEQLKRATGLLAAIEDGRLMRAEVADVDQRLKDVREGVQQLRAKNEQAKQRIVSLRSSLSARRANLLSARTLPKQDFSPTLSTFLSAFDELGQSLARTRVVLAETLVEVFDISEIEVPPLPGTRGVARTEWQIGGLVLPVPGDVRRYPPDHINAALTHTLQFLRLLTFYLGIKLPFEVSWSGGSPGVGHPSITAGKGPEHGGWASSKPGPLQPLHLHPSPPASSSVPATPSSPSASFQTGLAMLSYNVAYLAHTQGIEVPLNQVGDILRNLWTLCYSNTIRRRSHDSNPTLPPPTLSFSLEFPLVLQSMAASRPQRKERRGPSTIEEEGEWDLIEVDGDMK